MRRTAAIVFAVIVALPPTSAATTLEAPKIRVEVMPLEAGEHVIDLGDRRLVTVVPGASSQAPEGPFPIVSPVVTSDNHRGKAGLLWELDYLVTNRGQSDYVGEIRFAIPELDIDFALPEEIRAGTGVLFRWFLGMPSEGADLLHVSIGDTMGFGKRYATAIPILPSSPCGDGVRMVFTRSAQAVVLPWDPAYLSHALCNNDASIHHRTQPFLLHVSDETTDTPLENPFGLRPFLEPLGLYNAYGGTFNARFKSLHAILPAPAHPSLIQGDLAPLFTMATDRGIEEIRGEPSTIAG